MFYLHEDWFNKNQHKSKEFLQQNSMPGVIFPTARNDFEKFRFDIPLRNNFFFQKEFCIFEH
jgi:hypothetical protein